MPNQSFSKAVYDGTISGPEWRVVDQDGALVSPVEVVLLRVPRESSNEPLVVSFPRELTHKVISDGGVVLGSVIDFQR